MRRRILWTKHLTEHGTKHGTKTEYRTVHWSMIEPLFNQPAVPSGRQRATPHRRNYNCPPACPLPYTEAKAWSLLDLIWVSHYEKSSPAKRGGWDAACESKAVRMITRVCKHDHSITTAWPKDGHGMAEGCSPYNCGCCLK